MALASIDAQGGGKVIWCDHLRISYFDQCLNCGTFVDSKTAAARKKRP
jgi:hypothetical protein